MFQRITFRLRAKSYVLPPLFALAKSNVQKIYLRFSMPSITSSKVKKVGKAKKKVIKKPIVPVKKKVAPTKSPLRLGIIVGRSADTAKRSYLKNVPDELLLDNNDPPADVAIAWYIKKTYPSVEVDIITPDQISLERLNRSSFVYV